MKKRFLFLAVIALVTQGFSSSFDCPPQKAPFGCEATSKILEEHLVEQEDGPTEIKKHHSTSSDRSRAVSFDTKAATKYVESTSNQMEQGKIYRKPATPKKVWIFSREDSNKNFVEGHFVYFSLDDAGWIYQEQEEKQ